MRPFIPLALALASSAAAAQDAAIASWISLAAPPGHEAAAAAVLTRALPGWSSDPWGNVIKRTGSGTPRRVIACALDYSAYVVSQITEDGYLRLRRTGVPAHPLWDQFNEAGRVQVLTATRAREGVVAVANGHFARQHRADSLPSTVDQLWVDLGASSRAEVERLGVALLDPVVPQRPMWTFAGRATGPSAGARASCAAVATAAQQAPTRGENVYVLSTQRIFGWLGLSAALSRLGAVDQVTLVESGSAQRLDARLAAGRLPPPMRALNGRVTADSVSVRGPAVQWAGSLVETIANDEANALLAWVQREAALPATSLPWVSLPSDTARRLEPRADGYGALEREFFTLADLPGVSGHEGPVREAVLRALPAWARERAVVDAKGNIVVTAGAGGDAMAVVAHLDEVGFEVRGIQPDGRVTLQNRGGAVLPSWEGVPAYLHFDTPGVAPLRGVFVPRDSGKTRSPGPLTAWFGLDSAYLVARGVRPGLSLTAYKRGARLAGTRVTARGSDDRTGSSALLAAVRALAPSRIKHRVYFVWAVEEELGLNGARAFSDAHGTKLTRVYSVDTFVSSDTPLESPHFAYTPLGKGAVLRGLDDGSLSLRAERERVIRIAKAAGIPLQVGTTQGSTDGSAISPWGAPNTGLSWPGRYSHGPAEVLDLRDVAALKRLIEAVVTAP